MAYFPVRDSYLCPGCGGHFKDGGVRCAVLHAPGTCCHYGDTPLPTPQRIEHGESEFTRVFKEIFGEDFGR